MQFEIAMVAEVLDDNKPIKSLESLLAFSFKLHRSYSVSFSLANLGEVFFGTVSKFRKRKQQFLCCVHLLHKAGS